MCSPVSSYQECSEKGLPSEVGHLYVYPCEKSCRFPATQSEKTSAVGSIRMCESRKDCTLVPKVSSLYFRLCACYLYIFCILANITAISSAAELFEICGRPVQCIVQFMVCHCDLKQLNVVIIWQATERFFKICNLQFH